MTCLIDKDEDDEEDDEGAGGMEGGMDMDDGEMRAPAAPIVRVPSPLNTENWDWHVSPHSHCAIIFNALDCSG